MLLPTCAFTEGFYFKSNQYDEGFYFSEFQAFNSYYDTYLSNQFSAGPLFLLAFNNNDYFINLIDYQAISGQTYAYQVNTSIVLPKISDSLLINTSDGTSLFFNQPFLGAGALIQEGSGAIIINSLSPNFDGIVTLKAGSLTLSETASLAGQIVVDADSNGLILNGSFLGKSLVNNKSVIVTSTDSVSLDAMISGAGLLQKNGAGALVLTGMNTYSGGTFINDGSIIFNQESFQGSIENKSILQVTLSNQPACFSDILSGSGSLHKTGPGTLVLTGSNTYEGGTFSNEGNLYLNEYSLQGQIVTTATGSLIVDINKDLTYDNLLSIGGAGTLTKIGSKNLILKQTNTYGQGIVLLEGSLTLNERSLQSSNIENNAELIFNLEQDSIYNGLILGTGSVFKTGSASLAFHTQQTYSGLTTIEEGLLTLVDVILPGDSLNNSIVTFEVSETVTYPSRMEGSGSLSKEGTGWLFLTGLNSYTGGTVINQGSLFLNENSLQGGVINHDTLLINIDEQDTFFTGVIEGTGSVVKCGLNALTFSSLQTYTGKTILVEGDWIFSGQEAGLKSPELLTSQTTVMHLNNGAVYHLESDATLANNGSIIFDQASIINPHNKNLSITVLNQPLLIKDGGLIFDSGMNDLQFYGQLTDDDSIQPGPLTKNGTGSLILNGINSYTGLTTITEGVFQVNNTTLSSSVSNSGQFVFDIDLSHHQSYDHEVSGTGLLRKQGLGTLTLTQSHSYTGKTDINAGLLRLMPGALLNNLSELTIGVDSSFDVGGNAIENTIYLYHGSTILNTQANYSHISGPIYLAGNSTFDTDFGGGLELSGLIDDSGNMFSVTKTGEGLLTLSHNNLYSGGTWIERGTVQLTSNQALGFGDVTVSNNAILDLNGQSLAALNQLTLNSGVLMNAKAQSLAYAPTLVSVTGTPAVFQAVDSTLVLNKISGADSSFVTTGRNGLIVLLDDNTEYHSRLNLNGRLQLYKNLGASITMKQGSLVEYFYVNPDPNQAITYFEDPLPVWGITTHITGFGDVSFTADSVSFMSTPIALTGDLTYQGTTIINQDVELWVTDGFNPKGPIINNGSLKIFADQHQTLLSNPISGSGLITKDGVYNLTLSGDLSGFYGTINILQSTLTALDTLSVDRLRIYNQGSLIGHVLTRSSEPTIVEGNMSGGFPNGGTLLVGHNELINQSIQLTAYDTSLSLIKVGSNNVDLSTNIFSPAVKGSWDIVVNNGALSLNGVFGVNAADTQAVVNNGQLILQTGSRFGGPIKIESSGFAHFEGLTSDAPTYVNAIDLYGIATFSSLHTQLTQELDSVALSIPQIYVDTLTLEADSIMILAIDQESPDVRPLVAVEQFNLNGGTLSLSPIGVGDAFQDRPYPLFVIGEKTLSDNPNFLVNIQAALNLPAIFSLSASGLSQSDNNIVYTKLSKVDTGSIVKSSLTGNAAVISSSLASQILSNALKFKNNTFIYAILQLFDNAQTLSDIKTIAIEITPHGHPGQQVSLGKSHEKKGSAVGQSVLPVNPNVITQSLKQGLSKRNRKLLEQGIEHNLRSNNKSIKFLKQDFVDNSNLSTLHDFQHINLDGFSLYSSVNYSHQTTPNAPDDPGITQNTWSENLSISQIVNGVNLVGLMGSTTYNKQQLNPNSIGKSSLIHDRKNTISLFGVYQGTQRPLTVSAMMGYGVHHVNTARTWSLRQNVISAQSMHKSFELNGTVEIGWTWTFDELIAMQPYAHMGCTVIHENGYTENAIELTTKQPSGFGNITPKAKNVTLLGGFGVEFFKNTQLKEGGLIQINARVGFGSHKVTGKETNFVFAYTGDPGTQYTLPISNQRFNSFNTTLGFHAMLRQGVVFSVTYAGNFGKLAISHSLLLSGHYTFS